jgi:nucleoside-diphosphate-sugar epimerase
LTKKLIFGASGLVGNSLYKYLGKNKNYIFFSNKDKNFSQVNLDNKIPRKYLETKKIDIFFFSSPYFVNKNHKTSVFEKEFKWLKKVINSYNVNKLIYLSSPSIFYKKSSIGKIKKLCENFIIKNKNKIKYYQIWRPYNLVGKNKYISDHFHNTALKAIFLKKKNSFKFYGNPKDIRGYSDVDEFVRVLYRYSKKDKSYIMNYGNNDEITTLEVIKLYLKVLKKKENRIFYPVFTGKKKNKSIIKRGKSSIFSKKSSKKVLNNYLRIILNEKKM